MFSIISFFSIYTMVNFCFLPSPPRKSIQKMKEEIKDATKGQEPIQEETLQANSDVNVWCATGAVIKFWRWSDDKSTYRPKPHAVAINTANGVFQVRKDDDTQRLNFRSLASWEKTLPTDGYFTLSPDHDTHYTYGMLKAWSPNELLLAMKDVNYPMSKDEIYTRIGSHALRIHNVTRSLAAFQQKGHVLAHREGERVLYSLSKKAKTLF